jgi:hypothetical protein
MTYDEKELSVQDARPVELIQLIAPGKTYYLTSADTDISFNGNTYVAIPLITSDLMDTGDVTKADMTVQIPRDHEFGNLYKATAPNDLVTVTMFGVNYVPPEYRITEDGKVNITEDFNKLIGEVDSDNPEYVVKWKGRVVNALWDDTWLSITTESVFSSLNRTGVRRKTSAQCQYVLYGHGCNLDQEDYEYNLKVVAIQGLTIKLETADTLADGFFAGGMIVWSANGVPQKRMVKESFKNTGTVVLSGIPYFMQVGDTIQIYPGCDHTLATCTTKFNNSLNFGGQPFIPKLNPFDGSSVY